jgi:hypothetical protein
VSIKGLVLGIILARQFKARHIRRCLMGFMFSVLALNTYYISHIPVAHARVTPEDILNERREAYNQRVGSYSQTGKDRLNLVSERIVEMNKAKTDELEWIMESQARILDEYETRNPGKNIKGIEEGRYWITFAHEAVAYQAAKIYIFDLSTEANIEPDIKRTVGVFRSELNSTRDKVIKSQKVLEGII